MFLLAAQPSWRLIDKADEHTLSLWYCKKFIDIIRRNPFINMETLTLQTKLSLNILSITAVLAMFTSSCATQQLQPSGKFSSQLNVQQTTDLLYQQAIRCWQRPPLLSADGITARLSSLESGTEQLLTLHRAVRNSVHEQPFFVARIFPDNPTSVKVAERAYGYGLLGVEHLHLTAQLQNWLQGQTECSPLAH